MPPAATEGNPAAARILKGTGQVIAPPKPSPAIPGTPVSFRFEEAPVAEVVRTVLGDILKVDYVMHPPLQGTVTLSTRTPVTPDQAVFLLESALQANGLALVRDARGTFHAGRADVLKNFGGTVRQFGTPGNPSIPPGLGVVIIPLQYIGAGEMASILKPMVPPEALVRVDSVRNLLVMMGTRTQAEGWMELVNTFDVDLLKGMSVGVFPLKHATVKEVEAALRLVSGAASPAGTAPAAGSGNAATQTPATIASVPGAAAAAGASMSAPALSESSPLFGALRVLPIERINSILVVTPRASYLEEARRWIERIDQPSDGGSEPQLFVYQVQYGNARHLASVLSGLFGGQGAGASTSANTGVAPGLGASTGTSFGQSGFLGGNTFSGGTTGLGGLSSGVNSASRSAASLASAFTGGGGVVNSRSNQANTQGAVSATIGSIRLVSDDLNNSVLVWSTRAEFNRIEATLKRLDLPLTQVLIDASIIEVTLNDDLQYGLKWAFSGDARSGYSGIGSVGSASAVSQGFSYTLRNAAGITKATLTALAEKSLVKMLSNPSLMVLDNHTATIAVGDQIPVKSSTITNDTSGTTSTTIQYKDTGVNLAVTPSVTAGNMVAMQIDQTVTDAGSPDTKTTAGGGERPFLQRQISSKVAVRSGESIVLGGLIKNNQSSKKSGVPLLQDIPLVGNLFTEKVSTGVRTELLVIITPRVVRADVEIKEVSEDLRERLKGLRAIEADLPARGGIAPTAPQPSVMQ
ncbi:type II secretion system secretin GspD [Acidovorax sp. DW039]|uniref:type II secretion system secretin GspD n=1 Tax=Acidovorax sp. DW039 TaxID=3095606 RepID=UPI003086DB74|nr:type II secretion system secretin GspD [Acidovorax sp. DW039]